jgi:hypothetical protein
MSARADVPGDATHLCRSCRAVMCDDCRSAAGENEFLAVRRSELLFDAEAVAERARQEADRHRRRADDLDAVLRLGQNALLLAWMDSLTPPQLRAAVASAAASPSPPADAVPDPRTHGDAG